MNEVCLRFDANFDPRVHTRKGIVGRLPVTHNSTEREEISVIIVPQPLQDRLTRECNLCERVKVSKPSIFPTLNERLTLHDIERAKAHLMRSKPSRATGVDGSSYSWILDLDNQILCDLLNACVDAGEVPSAWLTTLIEAIRKRGRRDFTNPSEYRAVGLESCILKLLTLIIHMKLSDAAEQAGIIPPSQNGFREHHRTNNNVFILRTLIDDTRSRGETLYVAFVDISNAFPSTNQHRLWNKLYDYGLTGRYFDWLRTLYDHMSYTIPQNGELSECFHALCGVLMGDPASPTLWNLFLSSLHLTPDPDDADLCGITISHLEHADDIAIISRTPHGLQRHLHELESWCDDNFLSLDVKKSVFMIFGPLPNPLPRLTLSNCPLQLKQSWPYVGVWLQSSSRDIFATHYRKKSEAAVASARSVFGCERLVGRSRIPPHVARLLYFSLIDCHLTHGCDVAVDVDSSVMNPLFDIQTRCLHRILGLPHHSTISPLFTELGLLPLRTRRLELCLKFLSYLVSAPDNSLIALALVANNNLRSNGHPCWLMDVDWAISNLPGSQDRLPPLRDLSPPHIRSIITDISNTMFHHLNNDLNSMSKLRLLKDRLEPQETGPSLALPLHLRHYLLQVKNFRHRLSITRLLCGSLAPGLFQATPGKCTLTAGQLPTDFSCRLCHAPFETPEHVLLQCTAIPPLVHLRVHFRAIATLSPLTSIPHGQLSDGDALLYLKRRIFSWSDVSSTAKFIHEAIQLWTTAISGIPLDYGSEGEDEDSDSG